MNEITKFKAGATCLKNEEQNILPKEKRMKSPKLVPIAQNLKETKNNSKREFLRGYKYCSGGPSCEDTKGVPKETAYQNTRDIDSGSAVQRTTKKTRSTKKKPTFEERRKGLPSKSH